MAIMNFVVDQAATFQGVAFLSCQPKVAYGSTVQETTKDGIPKWEIQVVGTVVDQFGKVKNEVLKIGIASPRNPGEGLGMYTPIQFVGFEVGVMAQTAKDSDQIKGVTIWFRAKEIRALTATGKQAA